MVRIICPNCSHAFSPASAGPAACPKCNYVMAGAVPVATASPVFAPAGTAGAPRFSGTMAPPAPAPPAPVGAYGGPKTSGMAVTSMVLGIVGIVPFFMIVIPSLLAVIFGVVGTVQTRTGLVKGRGMAISGIVMGAVVLIGWLVVVFVFADEF
ncbi:MAG: DUF4190 domain-containing protein [Euryarchaeota archaeon]|nr:DUF4190 domain-containing protein [Euryarchaeota archaeon]